MVTEGMTGGLRKHVVDLLLGLDRHCYDITFVYSTNRADATARSQLTELSRTGLRMFELPMRRGLTPLSDLRCLVRLTRLLRKTRPDIVHCHGAKAGALGRIAARMAGVQHVIYTPHGGSFHKFGGLAGLPYLIAERLLTTPSVHFIGVSEDSCRAIKEYLRPRDENVHCVYNGMDVGEIDRQQRESSVERNDLGVLENRFVVLYPALFLEAKGHLEFLEALDRTEIKLRPEVVILLAGEGPIAEKVQRKITALGLDRQLQIIGFQPQLAKFYILCDLVLLPSKSEAFPYVLLEAMAFAKPVIATAVGGIPELVVHGHNGELVSKDNLGELVIRINHLSQHRHEADQLGRNGRATVEKWFSVKGMVSSTSRVYEKVLGRTDIDGLTLESLR